jgi:peptidase E
MTKYILHGGATGLPCENNDRYYREIINSASEVAKVLLVYFSVEESRWPEIFENHKKLFLAQAGNKKIEFTIASKNTDEFVNQVKSNDVVFIRGGNTLMLQRQLGKVANFERLLEGKTVAGSSAGALVFSRYYFDQDYDKMLEGLGILPVKMITHYLSDGKYAATSGKDRLRALENYKEKLPVYSIRETEYMIVEK